MVVRIEVMQIKEMLQRNIFIRVLIKVIEKASKQTLKHYFYNYLSPVN